MQQRGREAFAVEDRDLLTGNVEIDETYVGGKKKPGLPGRGAAQQQRQGEILDRADSLMATTMRVEVVGLPRQGPAGPT